MVGFEDVILTFSGKDYVVKSDKVIGLISSIENHISLFDLVNPQSVKNTRLAKAYHAALNYAGADCTVEQVYCALWEDGKENVMARIEGLLVLMIPPEYLRKEMEKLSLKKPKAASKIIRLFVPLTLRSLVAAGFLVISFGVYILQSYGGFIQ